MRIIILFNPAAGRGRARHKFQAALEVVQRGGVEPEVQESRGAEHLCELARQALAEQPDVIVSAGGDGTHHYVLNALAGSDVPMGILPLGSGNDLARGIGIPVDPRRAAAALLKGNSKRIDLGRAGASFYGGMAGAGLDAMVARYVNERAQRVRGRLAYAWGVLRCLQAYQPRPLEVRADGLNFSGEIMSVLVGNHPFYGGGFRIAPRARADDSLLDICLIPAMSKLQLLPWIPRVYRGTHLAHPRIQYLQTRRIELHSPEPLELFADGEFMQELPVAIEAAPRALRVIVAQ
ncbi:MAG: diacylglycerol kinase family lipid kinase [Acidobacteriia bacterium]|nr:diacylglycerol kinase family lipid kinase [Terriglobia bacterium]